MRILALDHGAARCGCALSDATGLIATPLPAIDRPDGEPGIAAIAALARDHEVELVVVGLPRLLSGEEGAQAVAARAFSVALQRVLPAPVELYDERFTTSQARAAGARTGATRASEDSRAAAFLLESYLEALHRRPRTSADG